jgi:hypothetical protein
MTPQAKPEQQERAEELRPEDEFVRQVEDHSLPARDVLKEQQEDHASNERPALFVP